MIPSSSGCTMVPLSSRIPRLQMLLLLPLLQQLSQISAFVPPKPGTDLAATYEPVHLYRQRRNITFDYRPTALHPESCRYLSELECQDADESMQRHQQRHRNLQKLMYEDRRRERRLQLEDDISLRGTTMSEDEELECEMAQFRKDLGRAADYFSTTWQPPTREEEMEELQELLKEYELPNNTTTTRNLQQAASNGRNPRVGTFRVLVLLMRFSDHKSRTLPDKYEYQILWNLRIRKWLTQNSYGKYNAWFDVQDWKQTDNTEKYYSFGQSGRVAAFAESYWVLLDELDKDPNWDWSPFDADNNGLLDNMIVIHSGYAAEEGGADCTNGREYLDRIWSHAFSDSNGWRNEAGTYGVEGYMISSGLDLTCDSLPSKMGVATHEYLHTFYLIDLYDYTFEGKGVGTFCIMAYPYGFGNDGYLPVSLTVWAKTAIDWLQCETINTGGTYQLLPAATKAACYKIYLTDDTEYLLLENRQQLAFDVNFWQSGVVIYHVDELADEQYNRGFPGQGGWPNNGNHYLLAVLQADGNYDLEQGNNIGDAGDMFLPGMTLGPNNDGKTYPNTDAYQGGNVKKTGVKIEIQEQQGNKIPVKISMNGRSGPMDDANTLTSVFSTPTKDNHRDDEAAAGQFRTPDAEGYRMSGKIPQLTWYDEEQTRQQQQLVLNEQGELEQQQQGGEAAPSDMEVFSASNKIHVLDPASSAGQRRHSSIWFASSLMTTASVVGAAAAVLSHV